MKCGRKTWYQTAVSHPVSTIDHFPENQTFTVLWCVSLFFNLDKFCHVTHPPTPTRPPPRSMPCVIGAFWNQAFGFSVTVNESRCAAQMKFRWGFLHNLERCCWSGACVSCCGGLRLTEGNKRIALMGVCLRRPRSECAQVGPLLTFGAAFFDFCFLFTMSYFQFEGLEPWKEGEVFWSQISWLMFRLNLLISVVFTPPVEW